MMRNGYGAETSNPFFRSFVSRNCERKPKAGDLTGRERRRTIPNLSFRLQEQISFPSLCICVDEESSAPSYRSGRDFLGGRSGVPISRPDQGNSVAVNRPSAPYPCAVIFCSPVRVTTTLMPSLPLRVAARSDSVLRKISCVRRDGVVL